MTVERVLFILAFRFADVYDTEQAWQKDLDRFKTALVQFDATH